MGREVRRVPLAFDWPLNQVWEGFLNPHYTATECADCGGRGESPEARRISNLWYGYVPFRPEDNGSVPFEPMHPIIQKRAKHSVQSSPAFYRRFHSGEDPVQAEAQRLANLFNGQLMHHLNQEDVDLLVEAGALHSLTHEWVKEEGWVSKEPAVHLTAQEVRDWSIDFGLGIGSSELWALMQARCARLGVSPTCSTCEGTGRRWPSEEDKARYDAWEETPPPTGEGYQLWETVSEGSPISPVFATEEDFVTYLIEQGYSSESARAFVGHGWAPSFVASAETGVLDGIEASALMERSRGT